MTKRLTLAAVISLIGILFVNFGLAIANWRMFVLGIAAFFAGWIPIVRIGWFNK